MSDNFEVIASGRLSSLDIVVGLSESTIDEMTRKQLEADRERIYEIIDRYNKSLELQVIADMKNILGKWQIEIRKR